jgi:O-antigen/teichoic acid export membrane protein
MWSLVAQQLTSAILGVLVIWRAAGWTPRLQYALAEQREILHFGANVLGGNLVTFLYKRTDVWLIGYFFGTAPLGYYTVVQRVLLTLALVTQSASQAILTPVLARVQHDKAQFRTIFERSVQLLNAVWAPLAFGAGAVAPLLVPLAFGARWQPATPLLQIMSFCAFTEAYTLYSGAALTACGRPAEAFRLALLRLALTVVVMLPATRLGLPGMAGGFVLTAALSGPLHLLALKRAGIVGSAAALLGRCARANLATLALGAAVVLLTPAITAVLPDALALAALIGIGGVLYLVLLLVLDGALVREAAALVGTALGRAAAKAPRLAAETGK